MSYINQIAQEAKAKAREDALEEQKKKREYEDRIIADIISIIRNHIKNTIADNPNRKSHSTKFEITRRYREGGLDDIKLERLQFAKKKSYREMVIPVGSNVNYVREQIEKELISWGIDCVKVKAIFIKTYYSNGYYFRISLKWS